MSIILDKVSYVYDAGTINERYALKCVSAKIENGEFVGVIGPTGSGKSTLMHILGGLLVPSGGTVYFDGEDIHQKDYDLLKLRSKVGLVFQHPNHQLFETTVFKDVCFGPKNLGWSKKDVELSAFEALYEMGITNELYYQSPFNLSDGQKKRVAIAGVLAMKPNVFILDEPTAGLDAKWQKDILVRIDRLRKEFGCTVILVSHNMDEIAEYVDRVMVLNNGTLINDSDTKSVLTDVEKLHAVGLAAPQVVYLMRELRNKGLRINTDIIDVEEAKMEILRKLR